jgi:hypothetical protein
MNLEGIAPGATPKALLIVERGNVNPADGEWQLAHDWPMGLESVVSKKRDLPRRALVLRAAGSGSGAAANVGG